jgi:hypothetical protein
MTRLLALGFLLSLVAGCPDNPLKASTWTKKLGDVREAEVAVRKLEELGDPSAIQALGEAWKDQGKPVRMLQVIIALARPLTAAQAGAENLTDFDGSDGHANGREAHWGDALPYLKLALTEVDEANPRSVDSAQKAADALGEAKLPDGLDALIDIANKPVTKKLVGAQISAIRAIGKYEGDKAKAGAALIKIVDRDPPDHPRTAKDKEQGRALEEKFGLFLGVTGAAINAMSDLRTPGSVKPLVRSMYRTPELFTQIRRALVASGPTAEAELRSILRGENKEVDQLFVDKKLDRYCGDKNDAQGDQCQKVSAKDFYPAVVLGDFYDPQSVPDLLVALKRPPLPQYYSDDQPSSTTQYNAIFDALKKIGAPSGADVVRSMWMGGSSPAPKAGGRGGRGAPKAEPAAAGAPDLMTRILAIGTYPFVTRDDQGVVELGKIAADNGADDNLRTEAATAFARLSHDANDVKILTDLAAKYEKASGEHRAKANGKPKADADAADKELDKAKKVVDDAKANALKVTHDNSKSIEEIKAATEGVKKAEDDMKLAKKKHKDAVAPFKAEDQIAKAYHGYQRMFQTHIARIEVALRCKGDVNCFLGTLKSNPDEAAKNCTPYIKDIGEWTKDEKLGLWEGEVERAMLEIGKKGSGAAQFADALLDAAKSDDRLIRQSILLALPKITKVPCTNCEAKLDAAIRAGEGKSTLGDLNFDTTMLRNYFAWAGGKTPSAPTPDIPVEAPKAPEPKKDDGGKKAEPAPAQAPAKAAPAPAKAAPAPAAAPKGKKK